MSRRSTEVGLLAPPEQPHYKRQDHTQQQTRCQRKIERRVFAANHDVAGQSAQADGQFFAEGENQSQRQNDKSKRDEGASDGHFILEWGGHPGRSRRYAAGGLESSAADQGSAPIRLNSSPAMLAQQDLHHAMGHNSCRVSNSRLAAVMASTSSGSAGPAAGFQSIGRFADDRIRDHVAGHFP